MGVFRPSELREFLQSLGIAPKKSLSQNFLIDANILRKILKAADVSSGDTVVEVGPGPGALTEQLLDQGAKVLAVEMDHVLAEHLERFKEGSAGELHVFNEDIMTFPIIDCLNEQMPSGSKAKVIANLPYHLTTPILERLIGLNQHLKTLTVMVQDEVARRITASPGTKAYSSFTVFLRFFCTPRYDFRVSRNCFYPVPKVDSAIVTLELREPPEVSNQEAFFKLTRTAFGTRRKMMRSSLRDLYAPALVEEGLAALDLNPLSRPEELSLEQFILLFEWLENRKDSV